MVQKLSNKVVDLETDQEASSSRKPFRQFFKKKEESSPSQPPIDDSSMMNLTKVGMDNFVLFTNNLTLRKASLGGLIQ